MKILSLFAEKKILKLKSPRKLWAFAPNAENDSGATQKEFHGLIA